MAQVIDYNGEGKWSLESTCSRYKEYCRQLRVTPRVLRPREHCEGDKIWIYPVMEGVIAGIEAGDRACCRIGIEFISEDRSFPFGAILKSNTARALRRTELSSSDAEQIRLRVIDMLVRGYIPREFKQYAKLLKKVGLGQHRAKLELVDKSN